MATQWGTNLGFRVRPANAKLGDRDDAADASRFLSRAGYAIIALATPSSVVIHPLALFVVFPVGVALVVTAAVFEGDGGIAGRAMRAFGVSSVLALLAALGWAGLSLLWTPYPVSAAQHLLKLLLLFAATVIAVSAPRENAKATDLYLFPIGVAALMVVMAAKGLSNILAGRTDDGGVAWGSFALAVLLFPSLGGLTARARNGYARMLLILVLVFAYVDGYAPLTIALFAGYLTLSFAISDLGRTTRELAWAAAALCLASPLVPAFAPTISAWIFHVKLATLPAPYPPLSIAADIFTHNKIRLVTGHGFETVARSVKNGILPLQTPRVLAFTVWYELGAIGAIISAIGLWLAFRRIEKAPARLAPFLAAALTSVVALAFTNVDFGDMTPLTLISAAIIGTDVAARSQYRTTRPSAASLANL